MSILDNPCSGVSEDVAALLQATATPLQVVDTDERCNTVSVASIVFNPTLWK